MKRHLLALLLVVGMSPLVAQVPMSGMGIDYASRFETLSRAYAKDPDNVEHLYNLAMFYFDNSNPMRNLPMAMRYVSLAEQRDIYLLENDQIKELARLVESDISITDIRKLKQSIHDAARYILETHTNMSASELDAYMDVFGKDADMAKMVRMRRVGQMYHDALDRGTIDAYYQFVEQYPGTNEAEQVEARIATQAQSLFEDAKTEQEVDKIAARYAKSPSVERVAMKKKSKLAFAEAVRIGTIAAYEDFLQRYPASDEQMQAREALDLLHDAEYSTLSTSYQLANFAETHADNPLSDEALAEIRRRIMENRDMEAARLYLSRFQYDPYYSEIFGRVYSWHTEEGNVAPLKHFNEQYPNFPLQRAVESDMDRAREIDRIDLTGDFLEVRFEDYGSYVRRLTGKRIAFVPLQRMLQGLLATRNYKAAQARMWEFDLCFDNVCNDEYKELLSLMMAPVLAHRSGVDFEARFDVRNPAVNPVDGHLYFTRSERLTPNRICYAVQERGKWAAVADVQFDNAPANGLTFYGFFDNGRKMLLGHGGDIWIAERDSNMWRISDIPPYPVNTDYIETDACMMADGSGLLLASDRPNGQNLQRSGEYFHGDTALATDLWFIPYTQTGWGEPVNLGIAINTPYSERSPLMSRNLKTLYYITDSRGLGYGDIYMATRESTDDWTHWSAPRNMGREVNSGYSEEGLSFGRGEKAVYFASKCDGGRYACYHFATTHDTASLNRQCQLAVDEMDGMLTRVRVVDQQKQKVVQYTDCRGNENNLGLNLHQDREYAIVVDAGERFVPAVVVNPKSKAALNVRGYTYRELVAMDKPLPLPVVAFDDGRARLDVAARMQLEQLAQFVGHYPSCRIEVVVNVAGRDDAICYERSLDQGRAIRDCLAAYGIETSHIVVSAYGNVMAKQGPAPSVAVRFRE